MDGINHADLVAIVMSNGLAEQEKLCPITSNLRYDQSSPSMHRLIVWSGSVCINIELSLKQKLLVWNCIILMTLDMLDGRYSQEQAQGAINTLQYVPFR
jgi:hypothetical protein